MVGKTGALLCNYLYSYERRGLKSGCKKKKTKLRVDVKQVAGSKEARARKRPVRFKVPANRRRRRRRRRLLNRRGVNGGGDDGSRGKTCA